MRQKLFALFLSCLLCVGLSACQSQPETAADSCWIPLGKAGSMENYMADNLAGLDMNALREEAGSESLSLAQQFRAVSLLCAGEYWGNFQAGSDGQPGSDGQANSGGQSGSDEQSRTDGSGQKSEQLDALFQYDYPESSAYADSFLAAVNADSEAFWDSLESAPYPYDCISYIFAAADELDGPTLANLISGIPQGCLYERELLRAIDKWIESNPSRMPVFLKDLIEVGYYDESAPVYDMKQAYLHNDSSPYSIQVETSDDALAYISCVRDSLIPFLDSVSDVREHWGESDITGENYYATNLAVTIEEEIPLQEPTDNISEEAIAPEGKKVIAFYRNPYSEEYEYSPTPLRVLGDFMMELDEDECPQTLAEADYYLVLTPSYRKGGSYISSTTVSQGFYSSTSIDLYEAGTGRFLRHLGNVMEDLPDAIWRDTDNDPRPFYSDPAAADILSYIYHNADDPQAYLYLLDNTGEQFIFAPEEPVILENWEVIYHSSRITDSFSDSLFRYTPEEGKRFVVSDFTVTNIGPEREPFLSNSDTSPDDALQIYVGETSGETFTCYSVKRDIHSCMNDNWLDSWETVDGQLLFQVPETFLQDTDSLCIIMMYKNQEIFYPLF